MKCNEKTFYLVSQVLSFGLKIKQQKCTRHNLEKGFSIYEHKTTITKPYMQLQREKDRRKNNENPAAATLNVDTDFIFASYT